MRAGRVAEIYGITYCRRRDLSPAERRNGRDTMAEEMALLARGKVGDFAEDDQGSDTRWMTVGELMKVPDDELDDAIETYFEQAKEHTLQFVKEMRERRDAADAALGDDANDP